MIGRRRISSQSIEPALEVVAAVIICGRSRRCIVAAAGQILIQIVGNVDSRAHSVAVFPDEVKR